MEFSTRVTSSAVVLHLELGHGLVLCRLATLLVQLAPIDLEKVHLARQLGNLGVELGDGLFGIFEFVADLFCALEAILAHILDALELALEGLFSSFSSSSSASRSLM
ncbi:hypothetical protein HYQ46_000767 [Verticillium longisporum]|nr:hypothetical protein HYQ46_000767 [Verticillium longisporum]